MSESVVLALVAALQAIILALIGLGASAVRRVAHNTNAIKDELVASTRVEERAKVLLELAEEKARNLLALAEKRAASRLDGD